MQFYKKNDPSKLGTVDAELTKYAGREEEVSAAAAERSSVRLQLRYNFKVYVAVSHSPYSFFAPL